MAFRFGLARKAFEHTGAYDTAIASTLGEVAVEGETFSRPSTAATASPLVLRGSKLRDLRYGENPHQPAAWYALEAAGLGAPVVLQGKELSFTNLLDLDAAARIVLEFSEPAASVIKHTNPCGVATGATIADAFVVGAAALAHVRADPLLPPELCEPDWPGDDLRGAYREYQAAFSGAVREWFRSR